MTSDGHCSVHEAGTDDMFEGVICRTLSRHIDDRGWLIELFRQDELPKENQAAMAYVSETRPGVARGPHEHVEQSDCFAFVGPGELELYLWDARPDSPTSGQRRKLYVGQSNPMMVVVPPGIIHAYRNISDHPAWVYNAPNRLYAGEGKRDAVDEIRHEDRTDNLYEMD